jgi:hypothetical protein
MSEVPGTGIDGVQFACASTTCLTGLTMLAAVTSTATDKKSEKRLIKRWDVVFKTLLIDDMSDSFQWGKSTGQEVICTSASLRMRIYPVIAARATIAKTKSNRSQDGPKPIAQLLPVNERRW